MEIIRQLKPKKYIKHPEFFIPEGSNTDFNLAPYNFYEVGLISQDILTINDLSHTIMNIPYDSKYYTAYSRRDNIEPTYQLFNLKYHEINTYTIKAVQELDNLVKLQQEQINTQQEQINTYQSQIDTLLSEVNILKNKLSNTNIF